MTKDSNVHDIGTDVEKWADPAMYHAEEMPGKTDEAGMIVPQVHLLGMTSDPLGHIAAMCAIYKGDIRRSLGEVTDEERRYYLAEMQKTALSLPLELVSFHLFYEGVTRAFTHQQVRTRVGVGFAQESMRFAVKEHVDEEVALPPSLRSLAADSPQRRLWQQAVNKIDDVYHALIASGVPAEDARGLLPTNITTRIHQHVNLRTLLEISGQRLCTQAQFEWRLVMAQVAKAIRNHDRAQCGSCDAGLPMNCTCNPYSWQYEAIADLLSPICYQRGKCAFGADFDRSCTIRTRVQANADLGRPSSEWGTEYDAVEGNPIVVGVGPQSVIRDETQGDRPVFIGAIHPAEWLADPTAARR